MSYVEKVDTNQLSATLKENGFGESRITYKKTAGDNGQVEIIIREDSGAGEADLAGNSLGKRIERVLSSAYPKAGFSGGQETVVSGLVGWEFSKSAMLAVFMAFIIIAAYISLRYEFAYAMAGLVALMHDVIISTGIFLLLGREISLNVIAALLTIIGYSINDTIVVFDRIRENLGLRKDLNYFQIINLSLNQTMARTLLTSFSTFLVLVVLLVAGGVAINDFVLVMLLGVLVGTYSSVFIASPLVALWHRRKTGVKEGDMGAGAITAEDVKAPAAETR